MKEVLLYTARDLGSLQHGTFYFFTAFATVTLSNLGLTVKTWPVANSSDG